MTSRNMETYLGIARRAGLQDDLTSEAAQRVILEAFAPDVEVHEPPSTPQGGVHVGHDAWVAMHHIMRELWEQKGEVRHIWEAPDDDVIVLYTDMDWTSRATGKRIRFPAVQVLTFRDGLIAKVEVFHQDSKAVIDTLRD